MNTIKPVYVQKIDADWYYCLNKNNSEINYITIRQIKENCWEEIHRILWLWITKYQWYCEQDCIFFKD